MADDGRTYIRVHDGMPDHPKVDALSDKAFRLLVETWCWSSRHLTDGRVPRATWNRRATAAARRELITAGLVEDNGADGVQMHDYLQHQRSRALVEAKATEHREKRAAAAIKANHQRWHVGPDREPSPDCELCVNRTSDGSKSDPDRTGDRIPNGSHIGIGIGREVVTSGGETPDSNAGDFEPPPTPILDPDNPRCAQHAHIPAGQPVPNCRDCAETRRQARQRADDDVLAEAARRAAWRAEVDACDECDENGKVERPDGALATHHQHPSDRREAS